MRSAIFEASFHGAPGELIERIRRVRMELEARGLYGTARTMQWRELARWLDIATPTATIAALDLARALEPHVNLGMSARCHPPQVWLTLSMAYAGAEDHRRQKECPQRSRLWLSDALPSVPTDFMESFSRGNPLHRQILDASP